MLLLALHPLKQCAAVAVADAVAAALADVAAAAVLQQVRAHSCGPTLCLRQN
jgi:hypothetical protein